MRTRKRILFLSTRNCSTLRWPVVYDEEYFSIRHWGQPCGSTSGFPKNDSPNFLHSSLQKTFSRRARVQGNIEFKYRKIWAGKLILRDKSWSEKKKLIWDKKVDLGQIKLLCFYIFSEVGWSGQNIVLLGFTCLVDLRKKVDLKISTLFRKLTCLVDLKEKVDLKT